MARNYAALAHKTFHPQMIVDINDTDKVMEVCTQNIMAAGYPCGEEDEDEWLEYVYAAIEMWYIAKHGFTYRRERNAEKRGGWEYVLYTRDNHPAYAEGR